MTALSELTAQPISYSTLQQLLSSHGPTYENLGAGVRDAAICLQEAQTFYDLPADLNEPLVRFRWHLDQAFAALEDARALASDAADLHQADH